VLPYRGPWDFLHTRTGEIWVTSDEQNVIIGQETFHLGLPSQLDAIDDEHVSIGSIFNPGAWIWNGKTPTHIAHTQPIVCLWQHEKSLYGIDYRGGMFQLNEGKVQSPKATLALNEVSRARRIGDALYLFDWTQPHRLIGVDINSFTMRHISLPDINQGNDIIRVGEYFYVLDKLQGYVFKYDRNFIFQEKRLGFGKGKARLFDPISIRHYNGTLHILSWLSQKRTVMELF
jgi:hypothetical protein